MAILVLGYGLLRRNASIIQLSYGLFVLVVIATLITNKTGHEAAHYLRSINDLDKAPLQAHVQAANLATLSMYATGLVALVGLFWKRVSVARYWPAIVLVISLVTFGFMANTGRLGGLIMHRELRTEAVTPAQP